jgi:hypothetical protein
MLVSALCVQAVPFSEFPAPIQKKKKVLWSGPRLRPTAASSGERKTPKKAQNQKQHDA